MRFFTMLGAFIAGGLLTGAGIWLVDLVLHRLGGAGVLGVSIIGGIMLAALTEKR